MPDNLRIIDVERIVVDVPFTPRCQEWNAQEIGQWRIVEVIRVTTDAPGLVGYGSSGPAFRRRPTNRYRSIRVDSTGATGYLYLVEMLAARREPSVAGT
jgi:hypothetical protein